MKQPTCPRQIDALTSDPQVLPRRLGYPVVKRLRQAVAIHCLDNIHQVLELFAQRELADGSAFTARTKLIPARTSRLQPSPSPSQYLGIWIRDLETLQVHKP